MYIFSPNTYSRLVGMFLEDLSSLTFYSGTIEFEQDDVEIRLVATIIPYHRREYCDGSDRYTIKELVPVWWELHTTTPEGEVDNDFDFSIFKDYICQ
ncbi:MAG: hypothetical protein R3Y68_01600 [Rikenellaceae bacterium]